MDALNPVPFLLVSPCGFAAKKFAENQPKKESSKKEKTQKEEKKAEKKEEKKAEEPEEELDACELALAAEPKSKDPFAHLPKR